MHWLLRRLPCVVAVTFSLFVCVVIPPNAEQRVLAHELQPAEPIAGSLLIVGGGPLPAEIIDRFFVLAGAEKARIIIVTTASSLAGTPDAVARHASWFDRKFDSIKFLHTRRREEANDPFFSKCLNEASGIWFMGGNKNWLAEAYLALGIVNEAETAAAVLGHNFPDSQWYKDTYALLESKGTVPRENEGSWISKAFGSFKLL